MASSRVGDRAPARHPVAPEKPLSKKTFPIPAGQRGNRMKTIPNPEFYAIARKYLATLSRRSGVQRVWFWGGAV